MRILSINKPVFFLLLVAGVESLLPSAVFATGQSTPNLGGVESLSLQFDQSVLRQGAMLTGTTNATSLEIFGRVVHTDTQGRFVFGLGRDAAPELELLLKRGDGVDADRKVLTFSVEQREYRTQSISGVAQKYVSPPVSTLERIRGDNAKIKKARAQYSGQRYDYLSSFIWPANGPVSGVYGSQRIFNGVPKRPHFGLDIAGPVGTPIIAPAGGVVTLVHDDMYYSGGTLIIDHGRGISSTFIHLDHIHVSEGEEVEQGQRIADMGQSGRVTGPHLDWRINWFDQRLDPELLLPPR